MGFMPTFCFRLPAEGVDVYRQSVNLEALLRPVVADMGYVFWGLELLRQGRASLLRIYIDSGAGVTLEDCERVSHRVSGVLDVEDPIAGEYLLEVSSPGLDRLLFNRDQYQQFVGETVKVWLSGTVDNRKRITGRIEAVTGETLVLDESGREFQIPLGEIEKARLCPDDIVRSGKGQT